MKRFNIMPQDRWGQTVITDIENTEPVCLIFSKYHPYAVEAILEILNQKYPEINPEVKKMFNIDG